MPRREAEVEDMQSAASPSIISTGEAILLWLVKIGRACHLISRYRRRSRSNALSDLSEHQLRDIGADAELLAHVIETRTLNSSRGPGGRIWIELMYRGPAS
jgi:hypothetical protein